MLNEGPHMCYNTMIALFEDIWNGEKISWWIEGFPPSLYALCMQILLDQIHCFCSLSSIALLSHSRTQMRLVLYEAAMKSSGIPNTVLLVQFCPTEIINKQARHQAPRGKTIQQKKWYKILVWEYTIPATTTVTAAATTTTCKSPWLCILHTSHSTCLSQLF